MKRNQDNQRQGKVERVKTPNVQKGPGIIDKIYKATTQKSIKELVKQAKGFDMISPKTLRRVNRVSRQRMEELKNKRK